MKFIKFLFPVSFLLCSATAWAAGVSIGGTRLIYQENDHEADITVTNTNKSDPALIQSWVEDVADQNKAPFIVTPPLFRLDAGRSNDLRVIQTTDGLAKNRETLFTLNIKVIPANSAHPGDNLLQFAIKNQFKLIYRPAGLPGSALDAAGHLQWSRHGATLHAENHSPYYVTVTTLIYDGRSLNTPIDSSVLAPQGSQDYSVPASSAQQVSWRILDDFGAAHTFSAALAVR